MGSGALCPAAAGEPWAAANLIGIDILLVTQVALDPDRWRPRGFVRPYDAVFAVLRGRVHASGGGRRTTLRAGRAYLFPVNCVYDHRCDPGTEVLVVRFRARLPTGFDVLDGIADCRELSVAVDDLRGIAAELAGPGSLRAAMRLESLVAACVSEAIEDNRPAIEHHLRSLGKYGPVFAALRDRPPAALRVKDLALAMHMTPAHLSAQFRKDTGVSLKRLIGEEVIREARVQLLLTDRTVRQIAYDLGFDDPCYFSRMFTAHAGASPKEFRAAGATGRGAAL